MGRERWDRWIGRTGGDGTDGDWRREGGTGGEGEVERERWRGRGVTSDK